VSIRKGGRRKREGEGACKSHLVRFLLLLLLFFSLSPCASIRPSIPDLSLPYGVLDWSRCALYLNHLGFFFSFSFSLTLSFPSLFFSLLLLSPSLPLLFYPPPHLLTPSIHRSRHPIPIKFNYFSVSNKNGQPPNWTLSKEPRDKNEDPRSRTSWCTDTSINGYLKRH
ncbi:uncharacterized protein CCOS01_09283, partial [Colletotrichum costaricense]